jgi:hypothetical protein
MKNLAKIKSYEDVLDTHRRLLCGWTERTGDKIASEYVNVKS